MTPDELARGGNPDRKPMSGCLRLAVPAVGVIVALLTRLAMRGRR